jgi:dTDP-4-amino-4,6-dideoxy-D-glucose acyltransferase
MYLTEKQLSLIGFRSIGKNVLISDKCSTYNEKNISIGDNVTIKDFCIMSAGKGGIRIGSNIMIEPYTSLRGEALIVIEDHCIISSKVEILSSTNDYKHDINHVLSEQIVIKSDSIIGENTLILPGVTIGNLSSVGAKSMVKKSVPANEIWGGVPAKKIGVKYESLKSAL